MDATEGNYSSCPKSSNPPLVGNRTVSPGSFVWCSGDMLEGHLPPPGNKKTQAPVHICIYLLAPVNV